MRLLNTSTLQLKEFVGRAPPYAILSHTWGDDEVLFHDFREDPTTKAGWAKVKASCDVARDLHHEWIWIDTCCIDKSSSAELSEAINSMFKWYEKAVVCLAYLSDISYSDPETDAFAEVLAGSRWFTRGWTLQELLAPRYLDFYSSEWRLLGSRSKFAEAVSRKTGIETEFLYARAGIRKRLAGVSVAARMCWASRRRTTRVEDIAYCLLGIFDINMPLIYGEGQKAFKRLQEIIIREIDDQSIFAWGHWSNDQPSLYRYSWGSPLLAGHPSWFKNSGDIIPFSPRDLTSPMYVEVNGITLSTPLWKSKETSPKPLRLPRGTKLNDVDNDSDMSIQLETWPEERLGDCEVFVAPLKCRRKSDFFNCIAISLREAQQQHSWVMDNPSCHRVSHMIYSAPRSTWTEESICKPFMYFQSDYERWSPTPDSEKGCVIRSIPRAYKPGKRYYGNGRYHPMDSVIKCYSYKGSDWTSAVVPLNGPVPNLTLVLQRDAKKEGMPRSLMRANIVIRPKSTTLKELIHMMPGGYRFNGFAELDNVRPALRHTPEPATSSYGTQHKLQLFKEFTIKVSKEPAYGYFIQIIDIKDPFDESVTRETRQLDCFTPVRRDSFDESDSEGIVQRPSSLTEVSHTPSQDALGGNSAEPSPPLREMDGDVWARRRPKPYSTYGTSNSVQLLNTTTSAEYDGSDIDE